MYLVGDTPETYSDILAKVNEITEREINASLNVKWLSWSEHDAKYSLLFSGKEDFDLIFTAPAWCHYEQTVALGGFLELTEDMISKYMPDVWAQLPEVAWKQAKINGKNIYDASELYRGKSSRSNNPYRLDGTVWIYGY